MCFGRADLVIPSRVLLARWPAAVLTVPHAANTLQACSAKNSDSQSIWLSRFEHGSPRQLQEE